MAFSSSSIPLYLLDDPPIITTNSWSSLPLPPPPPPPHHHHHHHHHHQSNQQLPGRSGENLPGTEFPPPLPPPSGHGGGGTGSVRPHSTAERARLAKIPQPEAGINCPRCDSTNTKFCYFNNYSLSQPRHFCKNCRRYWTQGGALRNVPVGGGCRRNKRAKAGSGRSKSPMTERAGAAPGLSNTTATVTAAGDILGHLATQLTQLPSFPPLHNLNEYAPSDVGAGIDLDFQVGSGDHSQWRMHQMPQIPSFFANTLEGQGIGLLLSNNKTSYSSPNAMADPTTAVKSEGLSHIRDLNLSSMNYTSLNEQYTTWVGNANWSDLSCGFSSAPTGHHS